MATAGDQINRALRIIGILAEGETPSAETSADALTALNQMLDSWSTERLSVFATQDQTFIWPSGQISRTLGPSGNFVGNRPIAVDDSTYFIVNGISYPIDIINQNHYNGIALKTVQSPYPVSLFVNMDFPNVTMFLYPVPSQALTFHFVSVTELAQPAALATILTFPPGYLQAFVYNLAVTLAPEFGVEIANSVKREADTSKRTIKRQNNPDDLMSIPSGLLGGVGGRFNIFSGD